MEVGCFSASAIAPDALSNIITGSTSEEPMYRTQRCEGASGNDSRGTWYSFQGNGGSITASLCGYASYDTMVCGVYVHC